LSFPKIEKKIIDKEILKYLFSNLEVVRQIKPMNPKRTKKKEKFKEIKSLSHFFTNFLEGCKVSFSGMINSSEKMNMIFF
jgi:hypothetical protein